MNVAAEFLPVIQELLAEFGGPATLTRAAVLPSTLAQQKRDPTLRKSMAVPTVINTTAVVAPELIQDDRGVSQTVTMATLLDELKENDTLTLGGTTYTVGKVTRIAPQGVAIVYKAEVS